MKISYFSVGLLALFSPLAAAWSKEDREIFRIRDEISRFEPDPAATFYDILGVSSSASLDDITKAYRLKTRRAPNLLLLLRSRPPSRRLARPRRASRSLLTSCAALSVTDTTTSSPMASRSGRAPTTTTTDTDPAWVLSWLAYSSLSAVASTT
ncbi:hypothetical protein NM208_g11430 [Fusarium decemcellulare]|uniref:Uncharacterized protein n=1 Tax=Fusarium decemcellulare TaxID=57161 RepID=A0ACC1RT83_9HYPO|nr:hypothetical protein NM208_g11430 [Fusarium decemcellulare]